MFDHVGMGVSSLSESKAFFLQALAPLQATLVMEGPYGVGIGQNGKSSLWLTETKDRPAPFHLANLDRRARLGRRYAYRRTIQVRLD